MIKEIWFDMDGTIANLYGVENWLDKLVAYDEAPYREAKALVNLSLVARLLNELVNEGWSINIVSWLSKNSNEEYDKKVELAKREWLSKHLKSVKFERIDIIAYGTPKSEGRNGILFDDEKPNRENWNGVAFDVNNIVEVLKNLR